MEKLHNDILPRLLDSKDICKYLEVGRNKALELLKSGEIKSFRVGKGYRVYATDLKEFMDKERGVLEETEELDCSETENEELSNSAESILIVVKSGDRQQRVKFTGAWLITEHKKNDGTFLSVGLRKNESLIVYCDSKDKCEDWFKTFDNFEGLQQDPALSLELKKMVADKLGIDFAEDIIIDLDA